MAKKLSLVLAAVAVLAFAIPSLASATKATDPPGTLAPVGTKITGTGTDVILQSTLLGKITCATLNINGEITKNDGTTVEGKAGSQKPTQAGCEDAGAPVIVTSLTLSNLTSTGTSDTGTVSFVANVDVGEKACTFTGTNVPGTIPSTGTSTSNKIKFTSAAGVTGSSGCGTAKLTGEFALETTGTTTPIILSS